MPIAASTSASGTSTAGCTAAHAVNAVTSAALGSYQSAVTTARTSTVQATARSDVRSLVCRLAHVADSALPQILLQVRRVVRARIAAVGSLRSVHFVSRFIRARTRERGIIVANLDATHTLTGLIAPAFTATGTITVDNSSVYTPSTDYVQATGTRRTYGVLLYALDVLAPADTADVPLNRHFLVSPVFSGTTGDPLYDVGAGVDAIGKKVMVRGVESLIFRSPTLGEVVIDVPGRKALRYETDPDTGNASWKAYRTMPQRYVDGLGAVELFDEAGIINFFALLIGSAMSQWTHETNLLYTQRDSDYTQEAYLPYLGLDYGVDVNASDPEAIKRAEVRSAVPVAKLSGTDRSIVLRLLGRGYDATVHEVWVNPGHPMAKLTADASGYAHNAAIQYTPGPLLISDANANIILTAGMSGGGDNVAATGYVLFRDGLSPADGDVLTITDGTSTVDFEFDDRSVVATGAYSAGASFSGGLSDVPAVPGSVSLRFESDFSNIVLVDDGVGGFVVDITGGDFDGITVVSGVIDYGTGVWSLTLSAVLAAGSLQTTHTSVSAVVSPGHTAVLIGATAAITLANFISAVNGSVLSITATDETAANFQAGPFPDQEPDVVYPLSNSTSEKGAGTAFITMPHGYRVGLPRPPYFPSSRIALYLSYLDGTAALDLTDGERERIATTLAPILPAYVDIRHIGAKFNVNGPSEEERLTVGEAFVVTSV